MPLGCASTGPGITFSVVVATRGRPALLRQALTTVGAQARPALEVLVVNDGGDVADTDPRDLAALVTPASLRVIAQWPRAGHAAARNAGVAVAQGSSIAILDDDDLWLPDHLAGLAVALGDGADLVYSDAELLTVDRSSRPARVVERRLFALPWDADFARRYNPVVPSGMAYVRRLHDDLGPFSVEAGHHWDWDFLLRAVAADAVVARVPRASLLYTIDAQGRNESARTGEMGDSAGRLASAHDLGPTAAHTFRTMLDEPDVARRIAPSERSWDGSLALV